MWLKVHDVNVVYDIISLNGDWMFWSHAPRKYEYVRGLKRATLSVSGAFCLQRPEGNREMELDPLAYWANGPLIKVDHHDHTPASATSFPSCRRQMRCDKWWRIRVTRKNILHKSNITSIFSDCGTIKAIFITQI